MARYLEIHPQDPQPRLVAQCGQILRDGGVIAYPTDSSYALACSLDSQAGRDRIASIRRLREDHRYTLMCRDFAQLGQFVHVDNPVFRAVRAATPGPYTFILPATKEVPRRLMQPRRKTVGVRIPDHRFDLALLEEMGEPIVSSTLILPGEQDPMAEPWTIKEELDHVIDAVVDCGEVVPRPTTIVDLSQGEAEVLRIGAGDPSPFA